MRIRNLGHLLTVCLSLVGLALASLVACTVADPSASSLGEEPAIDAAPQRGVILRAIDMDELAALRDSPPVRHRKRHLARLRAEQH